MNSSARSQVALVVDPRHRDLAGLTVNRIWPTLRRRLIGPFVFFDHLLPVWLPPGRGLDVPPHPHIGLATVTYLFAGEIVHRDSLGCVQTIRPGDLNWMTAGEWIVHSERSTPTARAAASELHAIQCWVALPSSDESAPPAFLHYPRSIIPRGSRDGVDVTLIAGRAFGLESPARTHSELFFAEVRMCQGSELTVSADLGDRAVYVVEGQVTVAEVLYGPHRLLVFEPGLAVGVRASLPTTLIVFGGAPLADDRFIWWNFVASSQERIDAAKRRWSSGDFVPVPGDSDSEPMPLPP